MCLTYVQGLKSWIISMKFCWFFWIGHAWYEIWRRYSDIWLDWISSLFFFFTSHNFSFFFLKLLVISLIFLWHKSATSAIHHLTLHNWYPISRISLFISKFKCREWSGPDPKLKKCTLCNLVSLNTSFFSLWFFCVINNCICRKHKMRREHWA